MEHILNRIDFLLIYFLPTKNDLHLKSSEPKVEMALKRIFVSKEMIAILVLNKNVKKVVFKKDKESKYFIFLPSWHLSPVNKGIQLQTFCFIHWPLFIAETMKNI